MKNIIKQVMAIFGAPFVILYTVVSFILPEALKLLLGIEPLPDILKYGVLIAAFSGAMLFAFPFIAYINTHHDRDKLTGELKEIADKINASKNLFEKIKSHLIVRESKLIENKNDFFDDLETARKNAPDNTEIRIMNFTMTIKEQKEKNARDYFEKEIDFYYKRNNVKLFKIVSIHTKEKFKECWELLKKAKGLENFHLAYLNIKEFNNNILPKITGVQIINDVVILMHPTSARIDTPDHRKPIFIKSEEIAEIYSDYHRKIWEEIEDYHNQWLVNENVERKGYIGHILHKRENEITLENRIWKDINSYMPRDQQFNDRELARIGIT